MLNNKSNNDRHHRLIGTPMNTSTLFVIVLSAFLLSACSHLDGLLKGSAQQKKIQQKVTFDLTRLDDDGLHGPADGKRSLSYEFCIPARVNTARQVMSIDPTAIVYHESPGRLQCGKEQYLVIGDTYQANYRGTLEKLVELEYVTRIQEAFFE
ncbi:hypothetical protein [Endozoicomonas sp. SCSIO W0465]|uniref:hypothetical protein n=1 Tax=Endozoicomonas sp. SCSIO W0465 TaxID=2918516 RepID=UPI002075EFFA|nr:hypothetical protein [Endozoicomonas sp. SCSIO W0465]USE37775.1 hypothetical protein MJO57_06150 [Endozoicomonas sp. SCSIO W0465]